MRLVLHEGDALPHRLRDLHRLRPASCNTSKPAPFSFNRIDTHMNQKAYTKIRHEADGMLCIKHKPDLSILRRAHNRIHGRYRRSISHHTPGKRLIRGCSKVRRQTPNGAGVRQMI